MEKTEQFVNSAFDIPGRFCAPATNAVTINNIRRRK
jgi:hypothetical protein